MSERRDQSEMEETRSYNPNDAQLVVDGLTKRFDGLTAVNSLSFAVKENEILGLIGPNGAGKSTTFNCITGVYTPSEGKVYYKGKDITGLPTHQLVNHGIARTFQDFKPLEDRSVFENIKLALTNDPLSLSISDNNNIQEKAQAICDQVGLANRRNQLPSELPHAGLLRLELARALATDPDLLLVDEPFAGLSEDEVGELSKLIESVRAGGTTLVIIDHNMRGLLSLIDRAIVLQFGSIIASGNPEDIVNDERVQEAYLGEDEGVLSNEDPIEEPQDDTSSCSATDSTEIEAKTEDLLNVRNVSAQYGKLTALHDVSVSVKSGEVISLIGPNGAGKSTFADVISGFHKYDGSITYKGNEISGYDSNELSKEGIVLVPEKRNLFTYMSVEDNLVLGAYGRNNVSDRLSFVHDVFPKLEERMDQKAHTLSGGEQQMLAIGRSLMSDPELLILDEPTLGLAPVIIDDISDAISTIQSEGVSIILCEQNVTFALKHADRLYLLENGRIEREGAPNAFKYDEYIQNSYLGQ